MHEMTSKPGIGVCLGMSQTGACVLVWWCPAYRWRELGTGSDTEQRNPSLRKGQWRLMLLARGSNRER